MEIQASRIYYGHFGMITEVRGQLQRAMDTLNAWNDITTQALKEDRFDDAARRLLVQACSTLEPIRQEWPAVYEYMAKHDAPMSIDGFLHYYRAKHGIELN